MKIAIIGRPGVGKTTLAKKLAKKLNLEVISSDDFIGKCSFKDAPHEIAKVLPDKNYIVEGVQVARMLRHCDEIGFYPDKVYFVNADTEILSSHRGLASLTEKAFIEWRNVYPNVPVEFVDNEISQKKSQPIHSQVYY